jgi:hypothetical protein
MKMLGRLDDDEIIRAVRKINKLKDNGWAYLPKMSEMV